MIGQISRRLPANVVCCGASRWPPVAFFFSFEICLPGGGTLVQSNRGGHRTHALHSEVLDATRELSANRRTSLSPEQENGQRLAGYADNPPGTNACLD